MSLDDVDATIIAWQEAVLAGTASAEGWADWINVPSNVGQVAAVRVLARERRDIDNLNGNAHRRGLLGPDRHRCFTPVVRRYELRLDSSRGRTPPTSSCAPAGPTYKYGELGCWRPEFVRTGWCDSATLFDHGVAVGGGLGMVVRHGNTARWFPPQRFAANGHGPSAPT
jgi:hypothetical protein